MTKKILLTKAEEEIMQVLWQLEKGFVREILEAMPKPQPHYNTVSTLLKILEEKGIVESEKLGNAYRFTPLISKDEYSKKSMKKILNGYFDGSFEKMLSFFVKEKDISVKDLDEILKNLKKQ